MKEIKEIAFLEFAICILSSQAMAVAGILGKMSAKDSLTNLVLFWAFAIICLIISESR